MVKRRRVRIRTPWMDLAWWLTRAYEGLRRLGSVGIAGLLVLVGVFIAATLLDRRAGGGEAADLVAHARERGQDPIEFLTRAARAHRLLLVADIHGSPAPKRLVADAIEAIARGSGLDAVVVEVESPLQPYLDRYLATEPEDASILVAQPGLLRERWGQDRELLALYRRIWALNRELGAHRAIRIIAADLEGWPPGRAMPPRETAALFARRDAHMADVIEREALGVAGARVLILVGGYHALGAGHGEFLLGGGAAVSVRWLGARLRERHATEVFTVLTDGYLVRPGAADVAAYAGTGAAAIFRQGLGDASAAFALPLDSRFDFLGRSLREVSAPGFNLRLAPQDYRLRTLADGYIYLGAGGG